MKNIKILIVRFKNGIAQHELPLFRGAIIHAMTNANVLFHNHEEDKYRYAYPLIQYKRINQCASVVCVEEGTEAIGAFFSASNFKAMLGNKQIFLEVHSIKADTYLVQTWNSTFEYHLRKWLPLNQENYTAFQELEGLSEKYAMLERLLVGNILSFAKGVNLFFEQQVICKITWVDEPFLTSFKGIKMMNFDLEFKSNVSLPNFIGLGKGVSIGHGVVVHKNEQE